MRWLAIVCLLPGCALIGGGSSAEHMAEVVLQRDNFVVQEPIVVEARCAMLFGGRLPGGIELPGIAIDDPLLWQSAHAELAKRAAGRHLIHHGGDLTVTGIPGLFNIYRLTLSADAVVFR